MKRRVVSLLMGLAGLLMLLTSAPRAAAQPAATRPVVVVLRENVDLAAVLRDHARTVRPAAAQPEQAFRHIYQHALKGYAANLTDEARATLARDPRVKFIANDVKLRATDTPPTGIDRIDAEIATGTDFAPAPSFNVAVLDTGIDLTHPELNVRGNTSCISGETAQDGQGHGSHVSGTIGARNGNGGVVGVVPGIGLYAVKVLDNTGSGSTSDVVCGIDWVVANAATANIKVINMSLGGDGSDDGNCGNTDGDALHQAVCAATTAGVTVVVSAGNEGVDLGTKIPASYNEAIAVTALADYNGQPGGGSGTTCRNSGPDDTFATFSNFAGTADLVHTVAAPGVCILSTYKDGGTATLSGTSMASPHVAGVAALYLSHNPTATPAQVLAALKSTGEAVGSGHTDPGGLHPEPVVKAPAAFGPAPTSPDLSLTKAHTGAFVVGVNGSYTLTVTNLGAATTGTITVTDTLPAGLSYISATGTNWSCSAAGQTVTCTNPGPLAAYAVSTITLTVAVAAGAVPSVTNTATVSTAGDGNAANDSGSDVTTVVSPTDLALTKQHTGSFTRGVDNAYQLTVTNSGGPTTGAITIVDTLPAGLTFQEAVGVGWTCTASGQTVTCTRTAPLATGASSSVWLIVRVSSSAAASLTNSATVSAAGDTNTANNTATDVTAVGAAPPAGTAPTRNWRLLLAGTPGNPVVAADGTIYITTGEIYTDAAGQLYAINQDGTVRWQLPLDILPGRSTPAVGADGTIYVHGSGVGGGISGTEKLYAVTPAGTVKPGWPFVIGPAFTARVNSSPRIGPNGNIWVGSNNTNLYQISPTGAEVCHHSPTVSSIATDPAIAADGSIYIIDVTTTLFKYSPTCSLLWSRPLSDSFVGTGNDQSPVVDSSGRVFAGSAANGRLYAFQADGTPLWQLPTGVDRITAAPAIGADGTVYLGADGLYAVAPDGMLRWRYGNSLFADAAPVVAPDGSIYWPDTWTFYALSSSGTRNWQMGTTPFSSGTGRSPAVSPAGALFVPVPTFVGSGVNALDAYLLPSVLDVAITKSHTGAFTSGSAGTYTMTVRNAGNVATSGTITVTDVLPAGLTFVSATGTNWSCSAAGQTVTCTTSSALAAGATTTITLVVTAGNAAVPSVTNTATVAMTGDSNAANNSASDPTTVNQQLPPAIPANLRAGTVTNTDVPLLWDDVAGETAFQIAWTPSSPVNYSFVDLGADVLTWTLTPVQAGFTYFFHVRACNAAGCSNWSAALAVTPGVAPATPGNLRAGSPINGGPVPILWDDNATGESAYQVLWTASAPINYQTVDLAANSTSWNHAAAQPNATYYYHVRACAQSLCSPWSPGLVVTNATAPQAPTNLRVTGSTNTSISIAWDDNSTTETAMQVAYTISSPIAYNFQSLGADVTAWTHTPTVTGATYFYHVRSCIGTACSPWSGGIAVTSSPAPAVPSNFRAGTITATSIQVLWDDGAGETSYQVARTPASPIGYLFDTTAANATSATYTGLTAASTYYFHIRACAGVTCSAWSAPLILATSGSRPLSPAQGERGPVTPPANAPAPVRITESGDLPEPPAGAPAPSGRGVWTAPAPPAGILPPGNRSGRAPVGTRESADPPMPPANAPRPSRS